MNFNEGDEAIVSISLETGPAVFFGAAGLYCE